MFVAALHTCHLSVTNNESRFGVFQCQKDTAVFLTDLFNLMKRLDSLLKLIIAYAIFKLLNISLMFVRRNPCQHFN